MDTKHALKLYVVLSKAYRAAAEADKKEITKSGLSPSEFAVLELLHQKGPQPIQKIAARVLLTSGSMTYVVSQLEKKGLVKRIVSQHDRRVFYAELTASGAEQIAAMIPTHDEFITKMMNVFSDEEAELLIEQLKVLGKTIKGNTNPQKEETL